MRVFLKATRKAELEMEKCKQTGCSSGVISAFSKSDFTKKHINEKLFLFFSLSILQITCIRNNFADRIFRL